MADAIAANQRADQEHREALDRDRRADDVIATCATAASPFECRMRWVEAQPEPSRIDWYKTINNRLREKASSAEAERQARARTTCEKAGIVPGEPRLRMTRQQALDCAWGPPDESHFIANRSGVTEQWIYRGRGYLYFRDGLLTEIQQ